jgi:hypothetical protein
MLTGASALRHHGLRYLPEEPAIHVLISHDRHRKSAGFVSIERTRTLPRPVPINQLDVAPVARAVVDAARRVTTNRTTRAFTLEAVQRGFASPGAVDDELRSAQRRGTALIREVIAEAKAGVRSAPDAELRQAVMSTDLPAPLWNPGVFLPNGEFLAQPDGLIEESMVAMEMDSREHHSEGDDWADTLERGTDMSNAGLVVVHVIPGRFRSDPIATLRRIKRAHEQGLERARPDLRVVPCEEFERIRAGWMQRKFGESA